MDSNTDLNNESAPVTSDPTNTSIATKSKYDKDVIEKILKYITLSLDAKLKFITELVEKNKSTLKTLNDNYTHNEEIVLAYQKSQSTSSISDQIKLMFIIEKNEKIIKETNKIINKPVNRSKTPADLFSKYKTTASSRVGNKSISSKNYKTTKTTAPSKSPNFNSRTVKSQRGFNMTNRTSNQDTGFTTPAKKSNVIGTPIYKPQHKSISPFNRRDRTPNKVYSTTKKSSYNDQYLMKKSVEKKNQQQIDEIANYYRKNSKNEDNRSKNTKTYTKEEAAEMIDHSTNRLYEIAKQRAEKQSNSQRSNSNVLFINTEQDKDEMALAFKKGLNAKSITNISNHQTNFQSTTQDNIGNLIDSNYSQSNYEGKNWIENLRSPVGKGSSGSKHKIQLSNSKSNADLDKNYQSLTRVNTDHGNDDNIDFQTGRESINNPDADNLFEKEQQVIKDFKKKKKLAVQKRSGIDNSFEGGSQATNENKSFVNIDTSAIEMNKDSNIPKMSPLQLKSEIMENVNKDDYETSRKEDPKKEEDNTNKNYELPKISQSVKGIDKVSEVDYQAEIIDLDKPKKEAMKQQSFSPVVLQPIDNNQQEKPKGESLEEMLKIVSNTNSNQESKESKQKEEHINNRGTGDYFDETEEMDLKFSSTEQFDAQVFADQEKHSDIDPNEI